MNTFSISLLNSLIKLHFYGQLLRECQWEWKHNSDIETEYWTAHILLLSLYLARLE